MGPKNQYIKRASHFSVLVCQNLMKNGQVMAMGSARAKVALAYFWILGSNFFWRPKSKIGHD